MANKVRYEHKECTIERSPHKGERCITVKIISFSGGGSQYPIDEKIASGECKHALECSNNAELKTKCEIIRHLQ